jgi:hypothetical protein
MEVAVPSSASYEVSTLYIRVHRIFSNVEEQRCVFILKGVQNYIGTNNIHTAYLSTKGGIRGHVK